MDLINEYNIFNIKSADQFSIYWSQLFKSISLGSSINCYDDYLKYINIFKKNNVYY